MADARLAQALKHEMRTDWL